MACRSPPNGREDEGLRQPLGVNLPADAAARLRLARTDGVGPRTFRHLMERFGSAAAALDEMPRCGGGRWGAPRGAEVAREMEAVAALGGRFLFLGAAGYPPLLDTLAD